MNYFTIRIDQTEKIHRTVQRLRGQQEDLMAIQRNFKIGVDPAQKLRLHAFDEVLKELECELDRLVMNRAAEAASESLVSGK